MKLAKLSIVSVLFLASPLTSVASDAEGMVNIQSAFSVKETADRMERILSDKGMTIFNRIDHSAGAASVDIKLPETELIIFGNPKVGSPLMKCQQSVAIDLPQKALIWKDDNTKVWISYNNPDYIKKRHKLTGCVEVLSKIKKALAGIAKSASQKGDEQ